MAHEKEGDFVVQLGNRLRKARKVKGYKNREDLAAKIGIHLSTYGNYERGERIPNAVFLDRFCNILCINHIWLLTGQGDITLPDMDIEVKLLEEIIEVVGEHLKQSKKQVGRRQKARVISILYEDAVTKSIKSPVLDTKTKQLLNLLFDNEG